MGRLSRNHVERLKDASTAPKCPQAATALTGGATSALLKVFVQTFLKDFAGEAGPSIEQFMQRREQDISVTDSELYEGMMTAP